MFLYRRIFLWAGQFLVLKWAKKFLTGKNKLYLLPIIASLLEYVRQKSDEKVLHKKETQSENKQAASEESKIE